MDNFQLFQILGSQIAKKMDEAQLLLSSDLATAMTGILNASLVAYILFYGHLIIAGRIDAPIKDFMWNIGRIAIVICILSFMKEYLTLIKDAVTGLKTLAATIGDDKNVDSIYKAMDHRFDKMGDIVARITANIGWAPSSWILGLLKILSLLPLFLGVCLYSISVLISEITTTGLMAVFPVFLTCYLWGWFKDMFSMWVQAVVGTIIFILFIFLFSNIAFYMIEQTKDQTNEWYEIFIYLISGGVSIAGTKVALGLSQQLSKVSISHTFAKGSGFSNGFANGAIGNTSAGAGGQLSTPQVLGIAAGRGAARGASAIGSGAKSAAGAIGNGALAAGRSIQKFLSS